MNQLAVMAQWQGATHADPHKLYRGPGTTHGPFVRQQHVLQAAAMLPPSQPVNSDKYYAGPVVILTLVMSGGANTPSSLSGAACRLPSS